MIEGRLKLDQWKTNEGQNEEIRRYIRKLSIYRWERSASSKLIQILS